ncbi:ArsR/SmtB family transcription factor [Actinoplanes subtropicus]|uniref:ArsR/SmtB family transcription factor n=1 Tax=Actinoplanes subtropicus TaxID=543632 RepID=UPI00054FD00B|nr:winged helix-turn-helix domain-containing protein [Actinoplanes subtropicus]
MLRIYFTPADLGRIRFAEGPDPMWEILLSLHALGTPQTRAAYRWWWAGLRGSAYVPAPILRTLAPPRGYSPDFLTPGAGISDLAEGIELVRRTGRDRLHADLSHLAAARRLPRWAGRLASGDPELTGVLAAALEAHFRVALRPYWRDVRAAVAADREMRGRTLLAAGADGLLATLHPTARWRPPVLEVRYPLDQDLHLGGRGLLLQPSVFCWQAPITVRDPALTPVLVYPAAHRPRLFALDHQAATTGPLTALLGRTRAATLDAVSGGPTTGDLARLLGVSAASASQQATVLRNAGLIVSDRDRNTVRHTLTDLGRRLLEAADPGPARPRVD